MVVVEAVSLDKLSMHIVSFVYLFMDSHRINKWEDMARTLIIVSSSHCVSL